MKFHKAHNANALQQKNSVLIAMHSIIGSSRLFQKYYAPNDKNIKLRYKFYGIRRKSDMLQFLIHFPSLKKSIFDYRFNKR